jgi:ABC-type transport system involved in Fe-S cluster assembly fused permease/ATPase subunit
MPGEKYVLFTCLLKIVITLRGENKESTLIQVFVFEIFPQILNIGLLLAMRFKKRNCQHILIKVGGFLVYFTEILSGCVCASP